MLQKVAVVEPHFLSKNCADCQAPLQSTLVRCDECGIIQPFPIPDQSCFEILSIFPHPLMSENELRSKFYELSKIVHPDKAMNLSEDQKRRALEWSAAINRAYRVLKDPLSLMEELLNHFRVKRNNQKVASLELAEAYFDFQEKWLEGDKAQALHQFMDRFNTEETNWKNQWNHFTGLWPTSSPPSEESLIHLVQLYETRKYLNSLKRDLLKYQVNS